MKTRVAILCGGLSGEHQVSLISAFNIASALSKEKYEVQIEEVEIVKENVFFKIPGMLN